MKKRNIPELLKFKLTYDNVLVITGVCLYVKLETDYKNNYGFMLTEKNVVNDCYQLTKKEIIEYANKESNFSVMDYSNIEYNFTGKVVVKVESSKDLQDIIRNYDFWKMEPRKGYIDDIKKAFIKTEELEKKYILSNININCSILPNSTFELEIEK